MATRMATRTKAETEQHYRELVAAQLRSGLSIKAFAESRGIPAGTVAFWRHELKRRDGARAEQRVVDSAFVRVRVVGAEREARIGASGYEVVLERGRVLRVPADFEEARVAALVRAVASC